jgi:DNA sulfur modification protein DndC
MRKFEFIINQLADQYLKDDLPWIIGFSGGKDSTLMLQLVWNAVQSIPNDLRRKAIHVVANDTLVENPIISDYLDKTLDLIKKQTVKDSLPIVVKKTKPAIEDSFWVNLIGKGYPAPINNFRWCTDRLKISPTSRYVQDQIDNNGEVIILLGTRKDESQRRKRSIQKHEVKSQRLSRHPELGLAFIYTPIKNVANDEVWLYLATNKAPWVDEENRNKLHAIYSTASSDEYECPTVVTNKEKPACGTSRFGCWTCTVIKQDKSLKAQITNGEEWLLPLLQLRDWLVENRDKEEFRMTTRRNGMSGKGPYTIEKRILILEKLLQTQKLVKRDLITIQELKSIQILWNMDGFSSDAFEVYNSVFNTKNILEMGKSDEIKSQQSAKLKELCSKKGIDFDKINRLLIEEKNKNLLKKRNNILQTIEKEFEIN